MSIGKVAALSVLMVSGRATLASAQAGPSNWHERTIVSKTLGKRTIYIVTPDGYENSSARYGVLVLLDADDSPQFQLWISQVRYLANNDQSVPPLIAVGIANGPDRVHDMTPAVSGTTAVRYPNGGGSPAFADFVLDEVLPMVRANYRTLGTTILAGHSVGGLFALDVAVHRPGALQAAVAISPSLWWDDSTLVEPWANVIATSQSRLRLFASSGGLETDIDLTTQRFARRLDSLAHPSVAFGHTRYPADTHALTPLSGLADGLRFCFASVSPRELPIATLAPSADSAQLMATLAESQAMYADSARALLLPETLPERSVQHAGDFALQTLKKPALAETLFRRNVTSYPESSSAHERLADALLAEADTAAAVAQLRQAAKAARATGDELSPETQAILTKLERRPRPSSGKLRGHHR